MSTAVERLRNREVEGADFPREWTYYSHPSMDVANGRMVFREDGTFTIFGPQGTTSAQPGTWKATEERGVLEAVIKGGEKGIITITGRTAVYNRERVGIRYLKATQP